MNIRNKIAVAAYDFIVFVIFKVAYVYCMLP